MLIAAVTSAHIATMVLDNCKVSNGMLSHLLADNKVAVHRKSLYHADHSFDRERIVGRFVPLLENCTCRIEYAVLHCEVY